MQVTELEAGHAEQLEGPGFDCGQTERPRQLRAAFEPFDGKAQVVLEHCRSPGPPQGRREVGAAAVRLQLPRPFNVCPTPGRVADDLLGPPR